MALKEQQKLEKELTGYVEWICRAGEGDSESVWNQTKKTINAKQQTNTLCKKDLYFIYPQLRVVVCEPHTPPHDSLVNFMFSEDLVLAEDRTTEVDRELIMEGGTEDLTVVAELYEDLIYSSR